MSNEVIIQLYLHSREAELGNFIARVIVAKILNKIVCDKHRQGFGGFKLTPQEELFSKLFNHEKILVKDMSLLELRAHIEELSDIAFEARARMYAASTEEKERTKTKTSGATGFTRSVMTDEETSNAINAVKTRQAKMSKQEKIKAGMLKLGIPEAEADKILSAGNMFARLKQSVNEPVEKNSDKVKTDLTPKPIVNPFAKKKEE